MQEKNRREAEADARVKESLRILDGVARDSETVGSSSLARTANRARAHLAGSDAPSGDPMEIWGRRIGRSLGLIAVVALVLHLLFTYVLK